MIILAGNFPPVVSDLLAINMFSEDCTFIALITFVFYSMMSGYCLEIASPPLNPSFVVIYQYCGELAIPEV